MLGGAGGIMTEGDTRPAEMAQVRHAVPRLTAALDGFQQAPLIGPRSNASRSAAARAAALEMALACGYPHRPTPTRERFGSDRGAP